MALFGIFYKPFLNVTDAAYKRFQSDFVRYIQEYMVKFNYMFLTSL